MAFAGSALPRSGELGSSLSRFVSGRYHCAATAKSRGHRVYTRRRADCLRMKNDRTPDASEKQVEQPAVQSIDSVVDEAVKSAANPGASEAGDQAQQPQYSLRTRLREETEAPFRKARMFVYGGSAVSAGVGAFIASLRIIAALVGISGTQPLNETVPNVAINLGVVALCAFLLRLETKAGERRLERMSRGARIGNLRIEDSVTRQVLRLKDLRGRSRIVLVAGKADKVVEAMTAAEEKRDGLSKSNLLIVPFVTDDASATVPVRTWRMQPFGTDDWEKWCSGEIEVAKTRLGSVTEDVLVVIIRLDGKVGARSFGAPMWTRLIGEISKLPKRDQYGKP